MRFSHGAIVQAMHHYVRNLGETRISMMAIAAIDNALWDLRFSHPRCTSS